MLMRCFDFLLTFSLTCRFTSFEPSARFTLVEDLVET
jgi:hypothetical protein